MKRFNEAVLNKGSTLSMLTGTSVSVFLKDTTTLATLYSQNLVSPSTIIENPTLTGADGALDFYVANGTYDLVVHGPNGDLPIDDVEIWDMDDIGARMTAIETEFGLISNSAAAAYAAEAEADADRAEAAAAALGAGGTFSHVMTKASDADADFAFISRNALGELAKTTLDLETAANRQILMQNGIPTNRIAASTVSGKLRLTSTQASTIVVGVSTTFRALIGRTVTGGGKAVTLVGTLSNLGFGLSFSATAPTLGGANATMPSDTVWLGIRQNGAVVALGYNNTTAGGVTITPSAIVTPWSETQEITYSFKATSATAGTISFFADGALLQTVAVTGLPSTAYVQAGVRTTSTDVIDVNDLGVAEGSIDLHKRIYLDVNNAGTALGTEANPWARIEDAIADFELDSFRREASFTLKRGVYRGQFTFDARRWRRIRIASVKGHGAIIRPSAALSGAVWTNIGGTECWYTANVWGKASNSLLGLGGLVETTSGISQAFGRTGLVTVNDRALYTKYSVGTSSATLGRGSYTVHQSSTYAGKVIVRCYDGGDPNSKTWEQMAYSTGISVIGANDTDWNQTVVELADLQIDHPMTYGVWVKRADLIVDNVQVNGTGESFGFELDEGNGRFYGARVVGSYADCYHSAGGLSSDANRMRPRHLYSDCDGLGAFASGIGGVSDIWSNHSDHFYDLDNCRAWGASKDGISAIDDFRLANFDARDSVNAAVSLAPVASGESWGSVNGGKLIGNGRGIHLNAGSNNDVTATIEAQGVTIGNNVTTNLETFSSGTGCTINLNAHDCQKFGTAPSDGHVKQGSGTTISVTTGTGF